MPQGRVRFFNQQKGTGFIDPAGGGEPVAVFFANIESEGAKLLTKGDDVTYEIGEYRGKPNAVKVRRTVARYMGTATYEFDLGYGFITPDGGGNSLFFHRSDVLDTEGRLVSIEDGEPVEYELADGREGKKKAARVRQLDPRLPLLKFADLGDFDSQLSDLAINKAQLESWNYRETPAAKPYPILHSYILYTFARLQAEGGKIAEAVTDGGKRVACWNTGLVTPLQEEIFAYFEEARPPKRDGPLSQIAAPPPWSLREFLPKSDRRLSCFSSRPEMANYFTEPADLLYDYRVELVPDWPHILQRKGRFPERFQAMADGEFCEVVEQKIRAAERRVKRNYKTAIPQFYRGNLQLLLPLCLLSPDKASLALVVSRDQQVYRASTVLPLDWAVRNARLVARPDTEWLDP